MFCVQCGKPFDSGSFCPHCGAPVKPAVAEAVAKASAPAPIPAPVNAVPGFDPLQTAPQEVQTVQPQIQAAAQQVKETPKKKKKTGLIVGLSVGGGVLLFTLLIGGIFGYSYLSREKRYEKAMQAYEAEKYDKAVDLFSDLGDYQDSEYYAELSQIELNYLKLDGLVEAKDYDGIITLLDERAAFYGDEDEGVEASALAEEYRSVKAGYESMEAKEYTSAIDSFNSLVTLAGNYDYEIALCTAHIYETKEAWTDLVVTLYGIQISDYKCAYINNPSGSDEDTIKKIKGGEYSLYSDLQNILNPADDELKSLSDKAVKGITLEYAISLADDLQFEEALKLLEGLGDFPGAQKAYSDAKDTYDYCEEIYSKAEKYFENGEYYKAKKTWSEISYYKDSTARSEACKQPMPEDASMLMQNGSGTYLCLTAPDDYSLLFRLYDTDNACVAQIFLAPGSYYEMWLATGTYSIQYAYGTEWYGDKDLFGEKGKYYQLKDGGDSMFSFSDGYYYRLAIVVSASGYTGDTPVKGGAAGM